MLPSCLGRGKRVRTIESLSSDNSHSIQRPWIAEQVPQCGYCQSSEIMAAAAKLQKQKHASDGQIDEAMTNICRCGMYDRIRSAIHRAANSGRPRALSRAPA